MISNNIDQLKVEVLLVFVSLAMVAVIIQDVSVYLGRIIIKLSVDQKFSIAFLKVRVEFQVTRNDMHGSVAIFKPKSPVGKLLPYFLVLSYGQVPEGPVVHLSSAFYLVLFVQGICVHYPYSGHAGESLQSSFELLIQLFPLL